MADKKFNIGVSDIVLAVVSVFFVAGIFSFFGACGPKADGSWMMCHWAGQIEKGLSVVLAVIALARLFVKNSKVKLGLSLSIVPVAVFAALVPGHIIHLCMMKTMRCHTIMHPAIVVIAVVLVAAAVIDSIIQSKK